jgi:nitrile hydratase
VDVEGAVPDVAETRRFQHGWEVGLFGIQRVLADLQAFSSHHFREAVERLGFDRYDNLSYYERWLAALETLVVEHNLVSAQELDRAQRRRFGDHTGTLPERHMPMPKHVDPPQHVSVSAPLPVGARVRLIGGVGGHHRAPDWAQGHCGVVRACRGLFPLPDLIAANVAADARYPLYSVEIRGTDVFPDAHRNDLLYVDAYGPYLTRQAGVLQ